MNVLPHAPARVLAVALGAGMVLDRFVAVSEWAWLVGGALATLLAIIVLAVPFNGRRWGSWVSTLAVVVALICLGGVRHHLYWWSRPNDNILHYAGTESLPVRAQGVLSKSVEIRRAERRPHTPPWQQIDHSFSVLELTAVADGSDWQRASGLVRLDVEGHLVHVKSGDLVEVVGHLSRAFRPKNPADLDFQDWLRSRGLDAVLRCEHPVMVQKRGEVGGWLWSIRRGRGELREACEQILEANLSEEIRPIGLSILLGDRSGMTEELRDTFTQSGTMHLLAISGLHVGLLLSMVFVVCRLLNVSRVGTALVLLGTAVGYAALTDQQPSVLRATLLMVVFLTSYLCLRSGNGMNSLCLSAAVLMLWQPAALFDIGAQLSFLAVGAILHVNRLRGWWRFRKALTGDLSVETSWWWTPLRPVWKGLVDVWWLSGGIWVVTAPLTMWSFHLLSVVGIVVNVLLIPLTGLVLGLGFATLGLGLLVPGLVSWVAPLFEGSLRVLLSVAEWCSGLGLGHAYLPGLPDWWVYGFYVGVGLLWRLISLPVSDGILWRGLWLWTLAGLSTLMFPASDRGLICTFLAVGHGSTVVLELPEGEVLVYDNGTFGDGRRAARVLENFLWSRGISRIDGIIISHADMDHFNGVSTVLETIPVGGLFCAQSYLDFKQEAVEDVCEVASKEGVPIRLIQEGDRLLVQRSEVELKVLHPRSGFRGREDNSNSVVLEVNYRGKRILLTGDVEGDGFIELSEKTQGPFDVLLSPHHGAKSANPRALFEWAQAQQVIISGGTVGVLSRIQEQAGATVKVFNTFDDGAIQVHITTAGELTAGPVREVRE